MNRGSVPFAAKERSRLNLYRVIGPVRADNHIVRGIQIQDKDTPDGSHVSLVEVVIRSGKLFGGLDCVEARDVDRGRTGNAIIGSGFREGKASGVF